MELIEDKKETMTTVYLTTNDERKHAVQGIGNYDSTH
jgi:hypothetical protein